MPDDIVRLRDQDLKDVEEKLAKVNARWEKTRDRYPFEIEIPASTEGILPLFEGVKYGMHRSAILRRGIRTYGFNLQMHADEFMRDFPNATGKFFSKGGIILNG